MPLWIYNKIEKRLVYGTIINNIDTKKYKT